MLSPEFSGRRCHSGLEMLWTSSQVCLTARHSYVWLSQPQVSWTPNLFSSWQTAWMTAKQKLPLKLLVEYLVRSLEVEIKSQLPTGISWAPGSVHGVMWRFVGSSWETSSHKPPLCKPQTGLVYDELWIIFRFMPIPNLGSTLLWSDMSCRFPLNSHTPDTQFALVLWLVGSRIFNLPAHTAFLTLALQAAGGKFQLWTFFCIKTSM